MGAIFPDGFAMESWHFDETSTNGGIVELEGVTFGIGSGMGSAVGSKVSDGQGIVGTAWFERVHGGSMLAGLFARAGGKQQLTFDVTKSTKQNKDTISHD